MQCNIWNKYDANSSKIIFINKEKKILNYRMETFAIECKC